MSFLGGLFESDAPDERFVDDQAAQEDYRNNKYVGHIIDQACTVYDTMFHALEYAIKGKANVLGRLDGIVARLERQCNAITEKYREILSRLTNANAGMSLDLSLDLAKEALSILNGNPVLRRYVGEANYWMLWDMLAVLSGQGMSVGADISANVKNAIKGTIYALLSMTNGMMHFESYISQITQFWGWLYMKEIWLPLTDSICPQVTCQYYYRKPEADNPVPGPANYAPMPFPIFDQVNYSWPYILSHFSYDNPDTWDVLLPESRSAMQKAYNYWKSNYTNAISANDLLSGASSKLTGGAFTVGFGWRNDNYGGKSGNTPLQIGSTFHQLDSSRNVGFAVRMLPEEYAGLYKDVDTAFLALVAAMNGQDAIDARDAKLNSEGYGRYAGNWDWAIGRGWQDIDPERAEAISLCAEVVASLPGFSAYSDAVAALSIYHHGNSGAPYTGSAGSANSPLARHLLSYYRKLAEDSSLSALQAYVDEGENNPALFAPYQVYSGTPDPLALYCHICHFISDIGGGSPFYSGAGETMASSVNADEELGVRISGGREPLFAAIGIYGDLRGLFPWNYEVVPLNDFKMSYTKIKGSYHIYYSNANPAKVIFADRVIQAGALKYIGTCTAAASDTVRRGTEEYTAYIFPSETCSVFEVPDPGKMFGQEFPSFASVQRVDAVGPDGRQFMYDLTRNQIPRYPMYVDPEKWSIMDLIHEMWLLADALAPICGDGGERRQKLNDLLDGFGLHVRNGGGDGPLFIGQLPASAGQGDISGEGAHAELEFSAMNEFASRIRSAVDAVYQARDEVLAATQAW